MKVTTYDSREAWLAARTKKITGSTFNDLAPSGVVTKTLITGVLEANDVEFKKSAKVDDLAALLTDEQMETLEVQALMDGDKKQGFYQLIADRLTVPREGNENAMDRGNRLEPHAIAAYERITGAKVNTDLVIWHRDDNDSIAISPDGSIADENGVITIGVEAKCLAEWKHIKAIITNQIPSDYEKQKLQYFIVNDDLQQLDFVLYNDQFMPEFQTHIISFTRKEVQHEIDRYLAYQRETIKEVNSIVAKLTS